jgi:hypothetical protein
MILSADLPGDQLTGVVAVILSAGAALFVTAWFNGLTKWRGGTRAGEARAIKNIEKWGAQQEQRAERAEVRAEQRWRLLEAERQYTAELERIIIREWGRDHLPPRPTLVIEPTAE